MDRMTYPVTSLSRELVFGFAKFQFSGSGGVTGFQGAGFSGVTVTGSTYTLRLGVASPQLVWLEGQVAMSGSGVGGTVTFNGAQLNQLLSYYTGSAASASLSGQAQTIDFQVLNSAGAATTPAYGSGSNVCFIQAAFLRQNYSKG